MPAGTNHQPPAESPFLSVLVGFLLAVFVGLYQVVVGQPDGIAMPLWMPIGAALLGGGAALFVGWWTNRQYAGTSAAVPWDVSVYRAGCAVVAAGWVTATTMLGDKHLAGMLEVWLFLAAAACSISVVFRHKLPPTNHIVYSGEVLTARPRTLADQVREAIAEASQMKDEKLPTVVLDTVWEPSDAGATFRVTGMRGTAFGPRVLREYQLPMAEILELPDGCPVQVRPGRHQNESLLDVSLKNYLTNMVRYDQGFGPIDIRNPFPIGINIDSSPTMIEVYQAAGNIIGQRGGGKTTFLHLLTLMVGRATNALVWHIDLNNGGMSSIWLQQFARGEVDFPVVDWATGDLDEAILMLQVAERIMLNRKQTLAGRLAARNISVLDVDHEYPEIIIVVDEAADVLGDSANKKGQKITALIQSIQRKGRAMAVNIFLSVLRGTGDMMPSDLKKGASLGLATRVKDDDELAYVFGWHNGLKSSNLTAPGMMFVEAMDRQAAITKIFFIDPNLIHEATLALQPIRSRVGLGRIERMLAGTAYTERWTRPHQQKMLEILAAGEDEEKILAAMRGTHVPLPPAPRNDEDEDDLGGDDDGDDPVETFNRAIEAAGSSATKAAPRKTEPKVGTPAGDLSQEEVDRMLAQFQALPEVSEPAVQQPPVDDLPPLDDPREQDADGRSRRKSQRFALLLDQLREAGRIGLETRELQAALVAAGFTKRPNQASEDLSKMRELGLVTNTPQGGGQVSGRWWAAV